MKKNQLDVFINNQSAAQSGACCCSGGCCSGGASEKPSVEAVLERFKEKHGENIEFNLIDLEKTDKKDYIEKLNAVLKSSGERLHVDEGNLDFVISKIAPVFAYDGIILSVKNCPEEDELLDAIINRKKIPYIRSCC